MLDKANWMTKSLFNNGIIRIYNTYEQREHMCNTKRYAKKWGQNLLNISILFRGYTFPCFLFPRIHFSMLRIIVYICA